MSEPETPSSFDPKAYRSALGGFGTGVALVAAHDAEGRAHGMIINSLTSVSLHPPIMLWCLANSSNAFGVFTNCPAFSLNILRSDDHGVAQRFSRRGDRIIPPEQVCTMETGAPVLAEAVASLGVALLKRMAAAAAAQLGPEFDVEILEVHHRHKKDAPSGTALALGKAVAEARRHAFEDVARYTRQGLTEARAPHEIGFAVMRAADVVGEHTVMFASEGERLELTHRANSRSIFASGAVRSAVWLAGQGAGWYDIADVLG